MKYVRLFALLRIAIDRGDRAAATMLRARTQSGYGLVNAGDLGLLILAFVAGLLALNAVAHWVFGPDPDLQDPEETIRFAPCGDPQCHNPHPYRHWTGRQR